MPQIGPNIDSTIWKFIQEAHDIDPMDDDSSDTLRHILIQLFRNTLVVHTNDILEKRFARVYYLSLAYFIINYNVNFRNARLYHSCNYIVYKITSFEG